MSYYIDAELNKNFLLVRLIWDLQTDHAYMQFIFEHDVVEIECNIESSWKEEIQLLLYNFDEATIYDVNVSCYEEDFRWQQHCLFTMIDSYMQIDLNDMDIIVDEDKIIIYGIIDNCLLN